MTDELSWSMHIHRDETSPPADSNTPVSAELWIHKGDHPFRLVARMEFDRLADAAVLFTRTLNEADIPTEFQLPPEAMN